MSHSTRLYRRAPLAALAGAVLMLAGLTGSAHAQAPLPTPACLHGVPAPATGNAPLFTTSTLPNDPFVPSEAVPDQWLAKLYTETLGCSPAQSSYAAYDAWLRSTGCRLGTLREVALSFLESRQFMRRPYTWAERLLVLWRIARQSEPGATRFANLLSALESGAKSWDEASASLFRAPGFGAFVGPLCAGQLYGMSAETPVIDIPVEQVPGAFAGGTGAQLQTLLDAAHPGDIVLIDQGAVVRVDGQLTIPPGVTLETVGAPPPADYAAMARLVRTAITHQPVVAVSSGATLANVWVDGQRSSQQIGQDHDSIDVAVLGGIGTTVREDRIDNTAGWSNMVVYEQDTPSTPPCQNVQIVGNLIDGYATKFHWYETTGVVDGRADTGTIQGQLTNVQNGQDSVSSTFGFADGISNQCWDSHILANQIVDATDVSIVLFGSSTPTKATDIAHQQSVVEDNSIANLGNSGWSAMTVDALYQVGNAQYADFDGVTIEHNLIWTSPNAFLLLGSGIGTKPWFGNNTSYGYGTLRYADNTSGAGTINTQMAIAVTRMSGAIVQGNTLRATLAMADLCPNGDYIGVDEAAGSDVQQPNTAVSFPSEPIPSESEGCLITHF